jgi:hypothetical protein
MLAPTQEEMEEVLTTTTTNLPQTTTPPPPVLDVISLLMPEVLMLEDDIPVNEIQDVRDDQQLFINLPQELAVELVEKQPSEEQTVLVATLVSLLSCCLVILIAAILYAKHRQQRMALQQKVLLTNSNMDNSNTTNNSLYSQYRPPYTIPVQASDVYEYCSSHSINSINSNKSSVYTTLPNGQLALVIPVGNSYEGISSMMLGGSLIHSAENFYVDIDSKHDLIKY